jgi:hypothetical protein
MTPRIHQSRPHRSDEYKRPSGRTWHDVNGRPLPMEPEHDPRALRRVLFGLVAFWALVGWWVL